MTDFADWQAPQAHATAISTTGVPLLRNITVLNTSAVLAAGTTTVLPNIAYGAFSEGYLIEVIPQHPGTRIFAVDLSIAHLDASGNTVAIEQITLSNWQNVGNDTSMVRGRLLGTSLTVTAQVAASAWLNTITGGSVTADSIQVRQCELQTYVPGTGKRVPVITDSGGLLLSTSHTVPLGAVAGVATLVQVLPDYTGPVWVHSATGTGGGFQYAPVINSYTVSNGTGALSGITFPNVASGTTLIQAFSLPSCFNVAFIIQRSTVSANGGFGITIDAADQ